MPRITVDASVLAYLLGPLAPVPFSKQCVLILSRADLVQLTDCRPDLI